jgi:ABC-type Na+ transport system ATPase subunit NatA
MKKFQEIFFDPQTFYDRMTYKKKIKAFNIRTLDKFNNEEISELLSRLKNRLNYAH